MNGLIKSKGYQPPVVGKLYTMKVVGSSAYKESQLNYLPLWIKRDGAVESCNATIGSFEFKFIHELVGKPILYLGLEYLPMRWIGMRWIGMRWIGMRWIGMRWIGMRWIGGPAAGFKSLPTHFHQILVGDKILYIEDGMPRVVFKRLKG